METTGGDSAEKLDWGDCSSKTITAVIFYVTLASASRALSLGDMSRKLPRGTGTSVEFLLQATTLSRR